MEWKSYTFGHTGKPLSERQLDARLKKAMKKMQWRGLELELASTSRKPARHKKRVRGN